MTDTNEVYRGLSNPIRRTAYDEVFWAKYDPRDTEAEESIKNEILASLVLVAQEVSEGKRRTCRRMLGWSKATRRAIIAAVLALALILLGGTSFVFAKPTYAIAAPFKGIAVTITDTSAAAVSLIENIRGVVAIYERNIVSSALQSMQVIEGLKEMRPVTVSTNDMACFPSPEDCLFPHYLDKRFSQFKYTVDSSGIVSVDTSGATTDVFLERTRQLLDQLAERQ
ncbi:hypothetical protein ACFLTO_02720 [Chloroflexota bacterium]